MLTARHYVLLSTLVLGGLSACGSAPKRLSYSHVTSHALRQPMSYAVWTPPDVTPDERLPLVVFLHGGGDSVKSFDEHEVGQRLDVALYAGKIPRAVIVVPEGEMGFWENWRDGTHPYRDWVVREVMPIVQKVYHTLPCPAGCHVMGVSMGGHGALRFALLTPQTFASASAISAPIFDTEAMLEFRESVWVRMRVPVKRIWGDDRNRATVARDDLFLRWHSQADLEGVKLFLAWGTYDRNDIRRANERFHEHLRKQNIEHVAVEYEGAHRWSHWIPIILRALREQVPREIQPSLPPSTPPEPPEPPTTPFEGW